MPRTKTKAELSPMFTKDSKRFTGTTLGGHVALFGDRVRYAREHAGLTQLELAVKAGLTPATVCRLERAKQTPHLKTVCQLAEALGVDTGWLIA